MYCVDSTCVTFRFDSVLVTLSDFLPKLKNVMVSSWLLRTEILRCLRKKGAVDNIPMAKEIEERGYLKRLASSEPISRKGNGLVNKSCLTFCYDVANPSMYYKANFVRYEVFGDAALRFLLDGKVSQNSYTLACGSAKWTIYRNQKGLAKNPFMKKGFTGLLSKKQLEKNLDGISDDNCDLKKFSTLGAALNDGQGELVNPGWSIPSSQGFLLGRSSVVELEAYVY